MECFFFLVFLGLSGLVGHLIGKGRGAPVLGAVLGGLLGPIGWILSFLIDKRPRCPACQSAVDPAATVCRHCRSALEQSDATGPTEEPVEDTAPTHLPPERTPEELAAAAKSEVMMVAVITAVIMLALLVLDHLLGIF